MSKEIVIAGAVRTAIGGFGGALKDTSAADLGGRAIAAALSRASLDPGAVDAVVFGNVVQAGNGMNVARQAALNGGLPNSVPALAVNRVCGSGAQAVLTAYSEIMSGVSTVVVAGGTENMDRAPYLLPTMRFGKRMGDAEVIDALLRDGLHDAFSGKHSGWHTEDLVKRFNVSRLEQDQFAAESQRRFAAAQGAGWFDREIAPVAVSGRKGDTVFSKDEANRPETTVESLSRLRPAFQADGTITAGNAPGINAGASAMVVTEADKAKALGLQPVLVVRSAGLSAVEPGLFGMAPIPAIRLALSRAAWKTSEVDRFEVNEAFAAIALVVRNELDIDPAKFNVDGGAIAHGHPIGATGAVLITKVAHAMQRTGERKAVVSLCIGGGQGIALCLERP